MISCMDTITIGMRGCLYPPHLLDVRPTDTWLSLKDYIIVWRVFRETIKRSHCSGNGKGSLTSESTQEPTSGEISSFIIAVLRYLYLLLYTADSISFM